MIVGVIVMLTLAAVLLGVSGILWRMKPSKKIKRGIKGMAGAGVVVAIIAILLAGLGGTTSTASTVDSRSGNPAVDLTVKAGDLLPAAAKCTGGDTWNQNSQPGTTGRLWTQSVSTPFTATDANAQFKELTSEICVNPTLGDAYAQAFEDAKIGSFSVGNANPWLAAMLQQSSTDMKSWLTFKVDSKGSYLMTGTGKTATKTKFVTANYQSNAELINTLLYVLDNQGTKTATSTVNWPLGALKGQDLPRAYKVTDPNGQENLPFMALTYTLKNGGCPYVLGVNLKDKRPENVACSVAVHIAPTTPTAPKLTVTPTPTTTPTGPTSTPTPSTPTSPPGTCVWKNGSVHKLVNGLCPKDGSVEKTNPYHTPASSSGSAGPPTHPSTPANPSTTPGSGSTQTAPGASSAPKPSTSAPVVLPSATGTSCIPDPDTGKGC